MKFVDEFINKEGDSDELRASLNKFNDHPSLARNLVGIYEFSKSDISSASYNPWYSEMNKSKITLRDIGIFKKFIAFQNAMLNEERKKYKECGCYLNQNPRFYIDGADLKKFNH